MFKRQPVTLLEQSILRYQRYKSNNCLPEKISSLIDSVRQVKEPLDKSGLDFPDCSYSGVFVGE